MTVDHRLFLCLSLATGWAGAVPYIRAIVRGETKPHMFSWLIWGATSSICCAVQFAGHGGVGGWCMASNSVVCFGIAVASLWVGTKDVRRVDWLVLSVVLAALPLWWITKNPLWSIVLITAIDGLGYVPTVRKSWTKPFQENVLSWAVSSVAFSFAILALETDTLANCLYPAVFIAVNFAFAIFLLVRRAGVKKSSS